MKSIPDLHVYVSWPFLFGNWELQGQQSRVNHRKQQRILGRSVHIYHSVTVYMSRSRNLLR